MSSRTNEDLLARYRHYARSVDAYAVTFVKTHLAEARGHWVDPEDYARYEQSSNPLHFRFVVGGLYPRKTRPKYPSKEAYTVAGVFDERKYLEVTRALTWEAATLDISRQKAARISPLEFEVAGISYDRNRGNQNFFRDDAPPEIKALAKNLNDRTDPLWDHALKYANGPQFVFEIRKAKVFGNSPRPRHQR